ncbi:hypothetical protein [Pseudochrobactrum sp. HB0163]|uniref:hypothetical protein n=1 Tax=Pseudochrobactrum sp. HB0163 TaxID=3450708 RepID=UPI003F6E2014
MKGALTLALVVATAMIAGCSKEPECTPELLSQKGQELGAAMQNAMIKDPAKMQELSSKVQELASKYQGKDDSQACKAYDELIAIIKG